MLCHLFNQTMERKDEPVSKFHIDDLKAVYKIKDYFGSHFNTPPHIANIALETSMNGTKMRKLLSKLLANVF